MATPIRSIGRRDANHIRPAPGSYLLRGPEKREPYVPPYPPQPSAPVIPPVPPSPVVVAGEVRLEGIPIDSVAVSFSGVGSVLTDSFGTYAGTLVYGYTGNSTPLSYSLPRYSVTPTNRAYVGLTTNQAGQDFDIDINFLIISGTVSTGGTGVSTPLVNTFGTFDSAANGSYGYYVPYGWTGSTVPVSAGSWWPPSYLYAPVGVDHLNQDFMFTPLVPPTPSYLISGSITQDGTGFSAPIVFDTLGTFQSAASGSYGVNALAGYSGTATPHWFGGSFVPLSRGYTSLSGDQPNQDYIFVGTTTPPTPTDCPIPGANVDILLGPYASRNVHDPVNNLLWVIDERNGNVWYIDEVAGTLAGSVAVNTAFGVSTVGYDQTTQKILCTTYEGSLAFINPATKAVTYSDYKQRWPGLHMLAIDDSGTAYVADNRMAFGYLYVVNCATEQMINRYQFLASSIYTDSICWASNIGKVVINDSNFASRFYLFDPSTGSFAPSALMSTTSFNYENYYDKATGHVLMSRDGHTAVDVVDISQGVAAPIIATLAGGFTRVSDATEDTCSNRLFVSDGNYSIYEFTNDGSYTLLNQFNNGGVGVNPVGLAHSRATNLIYYERFADIFGDPVSVKSIQATRTGTNIQDMVWNETINQSGNATGASSVSGGDGTFWALALGDDVTGFSTRNINYDASLVNLGAAYVARYRMDYTGSIWNDNATSPGSVDLSITLNSSSSNISANANGSFGGVLEQDGTVVYGLNTFNASANNGVGFAAAPPAYMMATVNGSISIRPLTAP